MISVVTLSLILILPWYGMGTMVFTFHEGLSDPDELSSATLTNAPDAPLPDHFIICSSHKQQQVDTANTNTVFVLYEDNSFTKPWFSIGFYKDNKLWTNTRYISWQYHGSVTRETLLQWVHICVEVDTINGILKASINGGNMATVDNVLGLTPVPKLYLQLGVVHESFGPTHVQFIGSVGNVNIFNLENGAKKNLSLVTTGSACKLLEGHLYLAWPDTSLDVDGSGVEESELNEKILCSQSTVLNSRLPLTWMKANAVNECMKYGKGIISKPPSLDMRNVSSADMEIIYGENYQECAFFWTPFNDKNNEGVFIDESTNETLRYRLIITFS